MIRSEITDADVIVVGAGSAGALMAARLTEDSSRQVIVLEAGLDWSVVGLPESIRSTVRKDSRELYKTEPDFYWQGLTSARFKGDVPRLVLRGRGVGGTSTINGCHALRPPLEEFDEWVELGCAGWGPAEVLPYFIKFEDDREFGDESYHGRGGPLPIRRFPMSMWGGVESTFRDSAFKLGYPWMPDHNAPQGEGFSPFAANILNAKRVTTNDAFLMPARDRPNLHVVPFAMVDRILLSGYLATGVRAQVNGEWKEFHANTVILSAGAPLSPGILQRSGIGRADSLRHIGITQLVDLPVGESMQDHAGISLRLLIKDDVRPSDKSMNCLLRWSSGLADAGPNDLHACILNATSDAINKTRPPALLCALHKVFSRGRVLISSKDPTQPPIIEHDLLGDQRDTVRMRALIRMAEDIIRQDPFNPIVEGVTDSTGATVNFSMNDVDLDHWCRTEVSDTSHIAGTCRMGDPDSKTTVVDPECRVLGIDGVRVVDASVYPVVTRASTHLTVLMIAEKVADMIRAQDKGI